MITTRVKICGITRAEDARCAAALGADAIGLVFYAGSSRVVSTAQARNIVASLPPFVTTVALFVDEAAEEIDRILNDVPIDMLQFHGEETPAFCRQFNRPWMKALRVRPGLDIAALDIEFASASAILLDAWQEGVPGGTGQSFDWELAPGAMTRPMVLAGGLHAGNVGAAIAALNPGAVDVSGGVESSPGIKDAGKISEFIAAVRAADQIAKGKIDDQ